MIGRLCTRGEGKGLCRGQSLSSLAGHSRIWMDSPCHLPTFMLLRQLDMFQRSIRVSAAPKCSAVETVPSVPCVLVRMGSPFRLHSRRISQAPLPCLEHPLRPSRRRTVVGAIPMRPIGSSALQLPQTVPLRARASADPSACCSAPSPKPCACLCAVAGALSRGDAALFLRFPAPTYREKIWDHAAGASIVLEAGGAITDAGGAPLDFSKGRWGDRESGMGNLSSCSCFSRGFQHHSARRSAVCRG